MNKLTFDQAYQAGVDYAVKANVKVSGRSAWVYVDAGYKAANIDKETDYAAWAAFDLGFRQTAM